MSTIRKRTALIVIAASTLAGCHPANPLMGTWQTSSNFMGVSIKATRQFNADGTELLAGAGGGTSATMAYSVQGNDLHERVTSMTIAGHTMTIDANSPANAKKELVEHFTLTGDQLSITNPETGVTQAYTKQTN